jgi:hypothetical protein
MKSHLIKHTKHTTCQEYTDDDDNYDDACNDDDDDDDDMMMMKSHLKDHLKNNAC